MKDLYNNSTPKDLLPAKRRSGSTSTEELAYAGTDTGTVVDLKGEGRKLLVQVSVGETATATISVTIQESSDNSAFTTLGDVIVCLTTGLTIVDLTPTKRYIRALITLSATAVTGTFVDCAVEGIVYNERYTPSNVS